MTHSMIVQAFVLLVFSKAIILLVECKPLQEVKTDEGNNSRSRSLETVNEDSMKSEDDYPLVFPKRAALLLDRLMVALHHALEDEGGTPKKINEVYRNGNHKVNINVAAKGNAAQFPKAKTIKSQIRVSPVIHSSALQRKEITLDKNEPYFVLKGNPRLIGLTDDGDGAFTSNEFTVGGREVPAPKSIMPEDVDDGEDVNDHPLDEEAMDLQRRGHGEGLGSNKGRVYWRCYFNAVTCF